MFAIYKLTNADKPVFEYFFRVLLSLAADMTNSDREPPIKMDLSFAAVELKGAMCDWSIGK